MNTQIWPHQLSSGNLVKYNSIVCKVHSISAPSPTNPDWAIELYDGGLINATPNQLSPLPLTEAGPWLTKWELTKQGQWQWESEGLLGYWVTCGDDAQLAHVFSTTHSLQNFLTATTLKPYN